MTTMTNKMPKLVLDSRSGNWKLSYGEKLPSGDWATRTVSTHTKIKPEAEAFRRRWMANNAVLNGSNGTDGLPPDERGYVLADLIDGYMADLTARGVGKHEKRALPHIKDSELGGMFPQELTPEVLRDYGRRRLVQDGTLRRELACIKATLRWALKVKKLKADNMPHITMPPEGDPRDIWLREEQEAKLWDAALGDVDRKGRLTEGAKFALIAMGTGVRREAIMDLTWDRVDMKARTIDFRVPGKPMPKNKKRPIAPITKRLLPVLERMAQEAADRGAVTGSRVIDADDDYPRKSLDKLLRGAGPEYKVVTPHVFRHTYITLRLRAGISMWDVSEAVAISPVVLSKHYAHHSHDKQRLIAQLDKEYA